MSQSKSPSTVRPYSEAPGGTYLDAAGIARLYGVTVATARKWAREGKITCYRTPGGRYRFASDPERRGVPHGK